MLKLKDRICSREYRVFLTEQYCATGCGNTPCDPCHSVSRKLAAGSDLLCIPLCRACHRKFDDAGKLKDAWFEKNSVSFFTVSYAIDFYQQKFMREQGWPEGLTFEDIMREAGFIQEPFTRRKNR